MKQEILTQFQGRNNVRHIVNDNGVESWITQEISFGDETFVKGACKLNTVENKSKHVLFLFNSDDEEVGRYYICKNLQGKTPAELVGMKHELCFFEIWNSETKTWVPCVGINKANRSIHSNPSLLIRNKPLHIGIMSHVWVGEKFLDDAGNAKEDFALLNDSGNLVYFTEEEGFCSKELFFQYSEGENTANANYIGAVEDFELVEIEQLLDVEELSIFGNYYSCNRAIIKPSFSEHQFYYWIRGGYSDPLVQSEDDIYGYFSNNECILLNYIYREKRDPFNFETYSKKKKELREYIDGLDINSFADNYNKEKHVDKLLFDYILEEMEYDRKFIMPKLLIWGK